MFWNALTAVWNSLFAVIPMIVNSLAIPMIRGGGDSKERALDPANTTLTLLPYHPDSSSTRGEVYVAMERWDDPVADLPQALKLRSRRIVAHCLPEKAYTGLSDSAMAKSHTERAKQLESAQASR